MADSQDDTTLKARDSQDVNPVLEAGQLYHVHGWNYKAQFRLVTWDIIDDWACIVTPKTRKRFYVPASKLFYAKKTKRKLSQRNVVDNKPIKTSQNAKKERHERA